MIHSRPLQFVVTFQLAYNVFLWMILLPHPSTSFRPVCQDLFPVQKSLPNHSSSKCSAVHIEGYDEAFRIVDQCAETGELSPALDEAVRFLEVNSYRIYPSTDPTHTEELWQAAQGSWKLMASTGSYKCRQFHPTPWFLPFPFAMIDGTHFGNGIGLDQDRIGLAFLHHAHFHAPHRRMTVTHPDVYVMGHHITVPDVLRPAVLKVVEQGNEEKTKNLTPSLPTTTTTNHQAPTNVPTFVLVGASEKTLIARGNQSGGLALWVKIPRDIRTVAYKEYPYSSHQNYQLIPQ